MPAPRSLTGEDVAELHCHGGPFLIQRVIGLAMGRGARMAERGEFSRRAFLNGRMDLTAAEAVADLISARGESALAQALAQLSGALKERVASLRDRLIAIAAHLEAEIDFSDEDIALPSRAEIAGRIAALREDVSILHESFARGRLMRNGARAAIIGKPNAGKSSVLNALLGVERAIVTPIPGTTRDVIEDTIHVGPYPLVIQDTAGVRAGADEVERIGIERTLSHAGEADLLIAVFDSSMPLEPKRTCASSSCAAAARAWRCSTRATCRKRSGSMICAGTGCRYPRCGYRRCAARASRRCATNCLPRSKRWAATIRATPSRFRASAIAKRWRGRWRRWRSAEHSARAAMPPEIVAVDVSIAADALASISGQVTSEDVLDAIFREFCIGK